MPDFGIIEALSAAVPSLFGAGEAAAAAAPAIGAAETGLSAAEMAIATGAAPGIAGLAPTAITVNAAAPAAFGVGDVLGGIGGGIGTALSALGPGSAEAAGLPTGATPMGGNQPATFDQRFSGAPGPVSGAQPTPVIAAPSGPAPGGGVGASAIAAPEAPVPENTNPFLPSGLPNYSAYPDAGGVSLPEGGTSGGGVSDLISKLGKGAVDSVTKNPIGIGVGAIPLIAQLLNKPKVPQQANLDQLVQQEAGLVADQRALGKTLTDPLVSGKLPSGAEQSVSNAINDAISTTKARYANLGLSGSTMEADAIANIQNQATGLRFQIAQQMAQTGQQAVSQAATGMGLQDQVYTQLMQAQVAQDQGLSAALARFAAAASGAPNSVNLKLS